MVKKRWRAACEIAGYNLHDLLFSPRTVMLLIAACMLTVVQVFSLCRTSAFFDMTMNASEVTFFYAFMGFHTLMCGMIFFVMISEIPRRVSFQHYALIRAGRWAWLNGQVLYCMGTVLIFAGCMVLFSLLAACWQAPLGFGWTGSFRLPDVQNAFPVPDWMLDQRTPLTATLYSLILPMLFWLTVTMVMMTFGLYGVPKAGFFLISFLLIIAYIYIQTDPPFTLEEFAAALYLYPMSPGDILPAVGGYLLLNGALYGLMAARVIRRDLADYSARDN